MSLLRTISNRLARKLGGKKATLIQEFHDNHYLRHNMRRLEHLASLGLPLANRSVLELGAGVGDHTEFFMDRNCSVCTSDGRPELVEILKERYFWMRVEHIDLDDKSSVFPDVYEVVYAYGLLYHLNDPAFAIEKMSRSCSDLLLLETCVTPGNEIAINLVSEDVNLASQARSGTGCRPTRPWVFEELKKHFGYVYTTVTQPWHPEFPLDWTNVDPKAVLTRAVFVAARNPLSLPTLTATLPDKQTHH